MRAQRELVEEGRRGRDESGPCVVQGWASFRIMADSDNKNKTMDMSALRSSRRARRARDPVVTISRQPRWAVGSMSQPVATGWEVGLGSIHTDSVQVVLQVHSHDSTT